MQIGAHVLRNALFAAPMAGVTDRPFRILARRCGAGLAISEMVSSRPELRGSRKSLLRLDHAGEPAPVSVQIAGAEPAMMADAARYNVERGAQIIDINMGCPAKKVCNVMAGSALMQDEPLVARILEAVVAALRAAGHKVSVDSGDAEELRRAARAGADYVLSLDETCLEVVAGTACVPILVPKPHGDLASLVRAIRRARAMGIPHIADPILDPIHFGFTASIGRYAELRRLEPDVEILMGTGNLTELTDADSQGVTAAMLGICSELVIRNVLVVQVSPHTRRTVEEHDAARRLMYRAREEQSLPKGYGGGLLSLHDLRPFPLSGAEVAAEAADVRDQNFRIAVTAEGLHVYNRDGHHVAKDPFALFDRLGVGTDGAHAFYLGYELAKAEIAWRLGKRYAQDNPLDWGVAAEKRAEDLTRHAPEGATLEAKRARARERDAARLAGEAREGGDMEDKRDAADRRDDRHDP